MKKIYLPILLALSVFLTGCWGDRFSVEQGYSFMEMSSSGKFGKAQQGAYAGRMSKCATGTICTKIITVRTSPMLLELRNDYWIAASSSNVKIKLNIQIQPKKDRESLIEMVMKGKRITHSDRYYSYTPDNLAELQISKRVGQTIRSALNAHEYNGAKLTAEQIHENTEYVNDQIIKPAIQKLLAGTAFEFITVDAEEVNLDDQVIQRKIDLAAQKDAQRLKMIKLADKLAAAKAQANLQTINTIRDLGRDQLIAECTTQQMVTMQYITALQSCAENGCSATMIPPSVEGLPTTPCEFDAATLRRKLEERAARDAVLAEYEAAKQE